MQLSSATWRRSRTREAVASVQWLRSSAIYGIFYRYVAQKQRRSSTFERHVAQKQRRSRTFERQVAQKQSLSSIFERQVAQKQRCSSNCERQVVQRHAPTVILSTKWLLRGK